MPQEYTGAVDGVADGEGKYLDVDAETKKDTKAKVPTYRYAQKLAMERGDAGTYFMRKTSRGKVSRRGTNRGQKSRRAKRATKR